MCFTLPRHSQRAKDHKLGVSSKCDATYQKGGGDFAADFFKQIDEKNAEKTNKEKKNIC